MDSVLVEGQPGQTQGQEFTQLLLGLGRKESVRQTLKNLVGS